jgi:hypothetical protein
MHRFDELDISDDSVIFSVSDTNDIYAAFDILEFDDKDTLTGSIESTEFDELSTFDASESLKTDRLTSFDEFGEFSTFDVFSTRDELSTCDVLNTFNSDDDDI